MSVELKDFHSKNVNGMDAHQAHANPAYQSDANLDKVDTNQTQSPDQVKVDVDKDKDVYENVDKDDDGYNACQRTVLHIQTGILTFWKKYNKIIWTTIYIILILLYFAYFGYAMYYRFGDEGSYRLLGFTIFVVLLILGQLAVKVFAKQLNSLGASVGKSLSSPIGKKVRFAIKWFLKIGIFIFLVVYIIVDIAIEHPQNLLSVAGLAIYILIFYLTSVNPAKVNWHPVFWGIALQYIFALLILRTVWGRDIFQWMGDRVTEFLAYAAIGAKFVFEPEWKFKHIFAMEVLPIVVFFYAFIAIMYFIGVMQFIVRNIGRFLAFCMGTSAAESLNAAANIFVGMTEAPLLIRPFLPNMTKSELHAVMTGGFATIAGSVLGAYVSFGVPANHLLSASVMSAPAALAISKLSYPETEEVAESSKDFSRMEKAKERNLLEAASAGASASIKLVGAIAVNVIAFLALLGFLNATLTWFGDRVGIENLTFELICSYVLYPVAFFMGADMEDCRKLAELIGVKTFTNEFIAYGRLRDLIDNRKALNAYTSVYNSTTPSWHWSGDDIVLSNTNITLIGGVISEKTTILATYALCGFSNFGSIGITLGGIGALAPTRRQDLAKLAIRAMIAGNVACFLTGCIAGLLYKDY